MRWSYWPSTVMSNGEVRIPAIVRYHLHHPPLSAPRERPALHMYPLSPAPGKCTRGLPTRSLLKGESTILDILDIVGYHNHQTNLFAYFRGSPTTVSVLAGGFNPLTNIVLLCGDHRFYQLWSLKMQQTGAKCRKPCCSRSIWTTKLRLTSSNLPTPWPQHSQ